MIFEDVSQKRWKVTLGVFISLCVVGVVLLGTLLASVVVHPPLPSVQRASANHHTAIALKKSIEAAAPIATSTPAVKSKATPVSSADRDRDHDLLAAPALTYSSSTGVDLHSFLRPDHKTLTTAFLVQDDLDGLTSFKLHHTQMDVVFPDWYFITKPTCDVSEQIDPDVFNVVTSSHVAVMPRVANSDASGWHTKEFEQIIDDQDLRTCTAQLLAKFAKNDAFAGLNLDIEALNPEDKDNYLEFLNELSADLHAEHRALTVDVPVNDSAYDLEYIGQISDGVVSMAYDEHFPGGDPGAIASQDWYSDAIDGASSAVSSTKLLMGIGSYGYDWQIGSKDPAQSLKFNEVMSLANDIDAQPEMDSTTRNMAFAYKDSQNNEHQVWFLNGVTAWNEWTLARQKNVLGFGVWRLGTEDPAIWNFINTPDAKPSTVAVSPALSTITYLNEGELFYMKSAPKIGSLDYTTDTDGTFDYAQYTSIPSGFVLDRAGNEIGKNQLVLTFDDGPDPTWTPKVLQALQDLHVPGTFFVVGDQAQRYPDLVSKEAADGFLVGNHTYLHTNLLTATPQRVSLELNSTQRTIEAAYQKKTILFRPPYDTDSTPSTLEQLNALIPVSDLGYIIVGANIDSNDWQKPGVDKIVSDVESQVQSGSGHIIVMHDAGGDRSETVAALRRIVPDLEAKGYTFTSLDNATGLARQTLMPPLDASEWAFVESTKIVTFIRSWGWSIIVWLFFLTTAISILRILSLGSLVVWSSRKKNKTRAQFAEPTELVSVLIPAYNEEKVIERTIHGLQKSTYKNLELLVIDDGSKDATSAIVERLKKEDPRITLITKPNGGKASALNVGFENAKGKLVVTIDGDTIVYPETIRELIRPFGDPTVDAVCGNVEVGNAHNLLTSFQSLEYITTQNFDRRAFDALNCISVVPGATGAWRREVVLTIGGYADDTLTEDADITLRLLRAGGKVVYAPEARSLTEAPENPKALAKQRFRWSYGTYQCLYKHRDAFFKGTLGWIALPNMFLFQILFPMLSPIGDLVFVLSIFRGDMQAILAGYLLFLAMDVCGSLLAFTLENRPKKLMWLVLIQRFYYRQFMYVVTFRAIVAILRGQRHGWNKLQRTGSVVTTPSKHTPS